MLHFFHVPIKQIHRSHYSIELQNRTTVNSVQHKNIGHLLSYLPSLQ